MNLGNLLLSFWCVRLVRNVMFFSRCFIFGLVDEFESMGVSVGLFCVNLIVSFLSLFNLFL